MKIATEQTYEQPVTWYPADLLGQIQDALGELADLEVRHDAERENLDALATPGEEKRRYADALNRRYLAEREPWARRLAALQARVGQ